MAKPKKIDERDGKERSCKIKADEADSTEVKGRIKK